MDAAVHCVDRITKAVSPPAVASVSQSTDNTANALTLLQRIEELSRRVESISAERDRRLSMDRHSKSRDPRYSPSDRPSSSRNRRPDNRSPSHPTRHCNNLLLVPPTLRRPGAKCYPTMQLQPAFDFCMFTHKLIQQRRERCQRYNQSHLQMAALQSQPGIAPRVHLAVRGGRRHPSPHRSRLPVPLQPLGGLQD
jgi:hypothetical protein